MLIGGGVYCVQRLCSDVSALARGFHTGATAVCCLHVGEKERLCVNRYGGKSSRQAHLSIEERCGRGCERERREEAAGGPRGSHRGAFRFGHNEGVFRRTPFVILSTWSK